MSLLRTTALMIKGVERLQENCQDIGEQTEDRHLKALYRQAVGDLESPKLLLETARDRLERKK